MLRFFSSLKEPVAESALHRMQGHFHHGLLAGC